MLRLAVRLAVRLGVRLAEFIIYVSTFFILFSCKVPELKNSSKHYLE